jgi:hypothetical protein
MGAALALLLSASIDGSLALRHASALAALGPHPWGSPRAQAAAQYVAAELRAAGLATVELQGFERDGLGGTNVVGTLPGPQKEFVLVCAHHDTAPDAPGAYDDGGGVGILVELARALVHQPDRTRTLVFASFDGEEAWASGKGTTAGSRAFIERLGPRARSLVAALAIEMSGWKQGTPLLHPIAYPDPRRPGGSVIAPAWLVRAALDGSREAGSALGVGDPHLSWLYQPAVRTFRVRLYGDDLSFLQAGLPAVLASDSSFSAFYPDYHKASDVAERLDAAALERMGRAVLGAVLALTRVPRGGVDDSSWFAAFGRVLGARWLVAVGVLSLIPGLAAGLRRGGVVLGARLLEAGLFCALLWLRPVLAVWLFVLPHLLLPLRRAWWSALAALAPLLGLVALGAAAGWRGVVSGVWLAPWEMVVLGLALLLALAGAPRRTSRTRSRSGRPARGSS